ncbi:MAG: hypothetical protein IJ711_11195 [Lachnospiraceae bacterium]|nr:hypothetical protein [Lachnospiraceae bacterium]
MEYGQEADRGHSFIMASIVLAVVSLMTIQFVILPFICGGLSILFALLSRGCMPKISGTGVTAIILSSFSMIFTVIAVIIAVRMLYFDPDMRQEVNKYSMQLYGQSFEDMLKDEFDFELPAISESK